MENTCWLEYVTCNMVHHIASTPSSRSDSNGRMYLVAGVMYMSNSSSQMMVGGILASSSSEAFPGNKRGSQAACMAGKSGPWDMIS